MPAGSRLAVRYTGDGACMSPAVSNADEYAW